MKEIKLSYDVFEQIKHFEYWRLTEKQELLIDELISNEELKKRYKLYGLCKDCKQPNTGGDGHYGDWCQSCNAKRLQQNFNNWTSGSHEIDELIQNAQFNAKKNEEVLEWIEYDKFENVEFLTKGGFETVYKTIWKDGYINCWDSENNQWIRSKDNKIDFQVVLKYLNDPRDVGKFLREIESLHKMNNSSDVVRCYGITKDPKMNNFMMVMEYYAFIDRYIKHGICEECKQPNTGGFLWCQSCNVKRFQQNFKNWTSGNRNINEFIQNSQLKAINYWDVLEWIEYDKFENVEYLAESEFGHVYKAIWKDGYIYWWDFENNEWKRYREYYKKGQPVALRYLHNAQNITIELLKEIELQLTKSGSSCYGITKHPKTNNFMMVFNMEEIKFSDDVFEQIKVYHQDLTEEQELFIDKLVLNKELNKRYKEYGLCKECKQLNTGGYWYYRCWCKSCNAKHLQQNFKNWTSGSHEIDEFIQKVQLSAKSNIEVLEWIEYDRFENVEYFAKSKFGTVYKAFWKDGYIYCLDSGNRQWMRSKDHKTGFQVALKCLHNSQDIKVEFLREIESHLVMNNSSDVIHCYGITKDPNTNNFIMVMDCNTFSKYSICKECEQPNTGFLWCQSCNVQHFQQNFKNWTSGSHKVDEFIQNAQLKARNYWNVLEWIEYDKFENVEYLAESEFGPVYKAIWKDGYIYCWDSRNNQWERYKEYYKKGQSVALKYLHDSQNITIEFLKEIASRLTECEIYYGITKCPKTNDFMMVFNMKEIKLSIDEIEKIKDFNHWHLTDKQELLIDELIVDEELKNRYKEYGLCKECGQPNSSSKWCQSCSIKCFQQNFKHWTSGNQVIDELIQKAQLNAKNNKEVLEWIEYDRFEDLEYLAKGGFGTVYRTTWKDGYIKYWDCINNRWEREKNFKVALKCLHNSQDITVEFLKEIEKHLIMNSAICVIHFYGITKDPKTNNFMMVMYYATNGSLRQYLNCGFETENKLTILINTAVGLKEVHNQGLIHRDFHCGNILSLSETMIGITDLGLCQPANIKSLQNGDKQIFGVLPFVAPEVLKGKEYTQASDIYAFGIIAYELYTGLPPYHDMAHEELLAIRICQGLRPKSNYVIPQLILDIIKKCWDADPLKRPNAEKLCDLLANLSKGDTNEGAKYKIQYKEADNLDKRLSSTISSSFTSTITTHPQAVYTSRLLDFKNLPDPKNTETECSESMAIDFIFESNSKMDDYD